MKKFLSMVFFSMCTCCFGGQTGTSIFFDALFKGLFFAIGISVLYLIGLIIFGFIIRKAPVLSISIMIAFAIFLVFFGHLFIWVP